MNRSQVGSKLAGYLVEILGGEIKSDFTSRNGNCLDVVIGDFEPIPYKQVHKLIHDFYIGRAESGFEDNGSGFYFQAGSKAIAVAYTYQRASKWLKVTAQAI